MNYGALMLKALFEHWPESHCYKEKEKLANMGEKNFLINSLEGDGGREEEGQGGGGI